jgi:hypothetical protein
VNQKKEQDALCLVAATSRTLTAAEKDYSIPKKEALALVYGLTAFTFYLQFATKIQVLRDAKALIYLKMARGSSGILARYTLCISTFDIIIQHIAGELNKTVDLLSRTHDATEDEEEERACLSEDESLLIYSRTNLPEGYTFTREQMHDLLTRPAPRSYRYLTKTKPTSKATLTPENKLPRRKYQRESQIPRNAWFRGYQEQAAITSLLFSLFPATKYLPCVDEYGYTQSIITSSIVPAEHKYNAPVPNPLTRRIHHSINGDEYENSSLLHFTHVAGILVPTMSAVIISNTFTAPAVLTEDLLAWPKPLRNELVIERPRLTETVDKSNQETLSENMESLCAAIIPLELDEEDGDGAGNTRQKIQSETVYRTSFNKLLIQQEVKQDERDARQPQTLDNIQHNDNISKEQTCNYQPKNKPIKMHNKQSIAEAQSAMIATIRTNTENEQRRKLAPHLDDGTFYGPLGHASCVINLKAPENEETATEISSMSEHAITQKVLQSGKISLEQFQKAQNLDARLLAIQTNPDKRKLLSQKTHGKTKLYYYHPTEKTPSKLYLPYCLLKYLFYMQHYTNYGMHRSANQITVAIREHFSRENMKEEISQLQQQCYFCITNIMSRKRKPQHHSTRMPTRPREGWGMDFLWGLPETTNKNGGVLMCVDMFSLYLVLIPVTDKGAEQFTNGFTEHILLPFQAPEFVRTDGESAAKSGLFQKTLNAYHIEHHMTPRNWPISNGLSERHVAMVKEQLRNFCGSHNTKQWDTHMHDFAMAHNSCPLSLKLRKGHNIGPITPEKVMFGYVTKKPYDLVHFTEPNTDSVEQFAEILHQKTQNLHNIVDEEKTRTRVQNLSQVNKIKLALKYEVNDIVWARTKPISKHSTLQAKYEGPYIVRDQKNAVAVLERLDSGKMCKVSFAQMLPAPTMPEMITHHNALKPGYEQLFENLL